MAIALRSVGPTELARQGRARAGKVRQVRPVRPHPFPSKVMKIEEDEITAMLQEKKLKADPKDQGPSF